MIIKPLFNKVNKDLFHKVDLGKKGNTTRH